MNITEDIKEEIPEDYHLLSEKKEIQDEVVGISELESAKPEEKQLVAETHKRNGKEKVITIPEECEPMKNKRGQTSSQDVHMREPLLPSQLEPPPQWNYYEKMARWFKFSTPESSSKPTTSRPIIHIRGEEELQNLAKFEEIKEELNAEEDAFKRKVDAFMPGFSKHLESSMRYLIVGNIGSIVYLLSNKLGCREYCMATIVLAGFSFSHMYDAYNDLKMSSEKLKWDAINLDADIGDLNRRALKFHQYLENANREAPSTSQPEYLGFLPTNFTRKNLISWNGRFARLMRESNVSKYLEGKLRAAKIDLFRSFVITTLFILMGYGFFCGFGNNGSG